MGKKNRGITLLVIIILLISIGIFLIFNFNKEHNIYSNIVESNWKIELPSEYKEIYSCDSGDSFLGDGERYHVFEYKDNSDIDNVLDWKSDKNIILESEVNRVLSSLNIDTVYSPDFQQEYKYYFKSEIADSSKLYIILAQDNSTIYIIEHFQ